MRRAGAIGTWALLALHVIGSAAAAQSDPALDPAALAKLRRMAEQLRSLPALRVEAEIEYDALQRDGQTIEFGSTRSIALRRPDKLRADATDRDGAQRSLYYDGKQVAVVDRRSAVHATAPQTGDVDEVLGFAEEQLGMPIPLGELLATDLGQRIDAGLVSAAVVGTETIDGVRCDHLALRNADRGIQLWVQQGETPLPRRISITWEQARGRPQFRAQLGKWELAPKLSDTLFAFEPPAGSERIRFHVRPAPPAAAEGR